MMNELLNHLRKFLHEIYKIMLLRHRHVVPQVSSPPHTVVESTHLVLSPTVTWCGREGTWATTTSRCHGH